MMSKKQEKHLKPNAFYGDEEEYFKHLAYLQMVIISKLPEDLRLRAVDVLTDVSEYFEEYPEEFPNPNSNPIKN